MLQTFLALLNVIIESDIVFRFRSTYPLVVSYRSYHFKKFRTRLSTSFRHPSRILVFTQGHFADRKLYRSTNEFQVVPRGWMVRKTHSKKLASLDQLKPSFMDLDLILAYAGWR